MSLTTLRIDIVVVTTSRSEGTSRTAPCLIRSKSFRPPSQHSHGKPELAAVCDRLPRFPYDLSGADPREATNYDLTLHNSSGTVLISEPTAGGGSALPHLMGRSRTGLPLRATNEVLLRARVPRAQETGDAPLN